MKIEKDILEIIEAGHSEGNLYYLPSEQLDRKVYEAVNKVLVALGGKWKGGKTKAHVFESSIDDAIENVILTGEAISRKQELQFFETPRKIADQFCVLAELDHGQKVLEPSAGRGSLIRAMRQTKLNLNISFYELDDRNFHSVLDADFGQCSDFLTIKPKMFDRILMNPPFSKQQDIDHVTHALKFLAEGGILVSVMSPAIKFRTNKKTKEFLALLDDYNHEIIDLPDGAFKESGTMVSTIILKVKNG